MKRMICAAVIFGFAAMLVLPAFATEQSKEILKQGVLGAVTGGVAAEASGGKAGKGALIGAGTNVIGGAVLDTIFPSAPAQQQAPVQQAAPVQQVIAPVANDAQAWYQKGYNDGFKAGYSEGMTAKK